MNDGKYSSEGLMTKRLNGCIALISRTKIGRNLHGIMTHYDPVHTNDHLKKIN